MSEKIRQFGLTTFSSLQVPNFRLYFIAQGISTVGTWMQLVAQAWLVLKLTDSGTTLGLVTAIQFLPVTFFGPMGGVIADRYNKRRILFVTQILLALAALLFAIAVGTGHISLWMIYANALFFGFVNAVDNPTRQTFVSEMVGKEHISNAVTLNAMEINLARVVGPAIAAFLIAKVGLSPSFYINAVSFLVVIVCLLFVDKHALHPSKQTKHMKGQLQAGFKYVWRTPILRNVLLMLVIIGTLTYEFQIILPLLAKYTFGGNASSLALLTSSMGIGSVVGGLFTASRNKTAPRALILTTILLGIAILATAVAVNIAWAMAGLFAVGICSIAFISLSNSILQIESSTEMRGRVMALWTVGFLGTTPIGGPIIGYIGEHQNPRWGLATGGFAALFVGLIGFIGIRRQPVHIRTELEPES